MLVDKQSTDIPLSNCPLAFLQGYGQLNLFAGGFVSSGSAISGIGFGAQIFNNHIDCNDGWNNVACLDG